MKNPIIGPNYHDHRPMCTSATTAGTTCPGLAAFHIFFVSPTEGPFSVGACHRHAHLARQVGDGLYLFEHEYGGTCGLPGTRPSKAGCEFSDF